MLITCTNVGALGSGTYELVRGINAVVGPNGSGKSTLVNALYFAFTGDTINGENLDSLISWGSPSCDITVQGDGYSISRTVNRTGTCKVKFCRGTVTVTRKKEVDQAICEMFGFVDLTILKLVFFAEQYRAIDFINTTDASRVQLLSSLFGFARLEKLRSDIMQAVSSLDTNSVSSDVLSQLYNSLTQAVSNRDATIKRHTELSADILPSDELSELTKERGRPVEGTIASRTAELEEYRTDYANKKAELDCIPQPPTSDDVKKFNDIIRHRDLSMELVEATRVVESLQQQVGLTPEAISGFLVRVESSKAAIVARKAELERQLGLLKSGKCPLTGGVPCPDLLALTDEESVNSQIDELDTKYAQLEADGIEMQTAYTSAVSLDRQLSEARFNLQAIEKELSSIHIDADFDIAKYEESAACSADSESRRNQLMMDISSLNLRIKAAEDELSKYRGVGEISQDRLSDIESRICKSEAASAAISELENMIPVLEQSVADQQSALDFATEQNNTAAKNSAKKDTLLAVRQALHRDNLPRLLVEDMLDAVNTKVDVYLRKFSFPYEVRWTSEGAIMYSDGVDWHRASQLSGGQKYVLVISIRCALADMLSSSFPLFVLDEPTTGLDVDNREALSKVLMSVVGQLPGNYLVVPTHDDMLLPEANIIPTV